MSNNEGLAAQLDSIIDSVMLPLEEAGQNVDVNHVADQVDRIIDPQCLSPFVKTYSSTMNIRARVRQRAAKRHDPVVRADDYIAGQTDAFDGILQAYYPESKSLYVPRERLTEAGYLKVRGRMRSAGHALLEHTDALDAWWAGKVNTPEDEPVI